MLIFLMFSLETSWGLNSDKCETSLSMMLASQDWPHIKFWWMMLEQIGNKTWSRREAVQSYWELGKQVHVCCSFFCLKEALMLSKRWATFLWRCECRSTCWTSVGLFNFLNVYVQCMLLKLWYKFKAPVFLGSPLPSLSSATTKSSMILNEMQPSYIMVAISMVRLWQASPGTQVSEVWTHG